MNRIQADIWNLLLTIFTLVLLLGLSGCIRKTAHVVYSHDHPTASYCSKKGDFEIFIIQRSGPDRSVSHAR